MTEKEQQNLAKAEHKQRLAVKGIGNRLLSQFSFQNIKTWRDIYRFTGYDEAYINEHFNEEQRNKPVVLADIKAWNKKLIDDLESSIVAKNGKPILQESVVTELVTEKSKNTNIKESVSLTPASAVVAVVTKEVDESGFNNSNNYGLCTSPKETAYLFWFQKKCVKEALDKIIGFDTGNFTDTIALKAAFQSSAVVRNPLPAILILASTGTGKTFMEAALDRRLHDIDFAKDKTFGFVPYISITRATIVEQTKRVKRNFFNLKHPADTEVINIEQLRSRAGQMWVESQRVIVNGEEQEVWKWRALVNPAVLYLDECQGVKNSDSTQHKIIVSFSHIKTPTTQVYISATPFTRVSEAKAFAIATKKDISHIIGIAGARLSENTWPTYAAIIAGSTSSPEEYNEAAVERLMVDLDDYIVRVKGVRWQFNAINKVEIIDFDSEDTRLEYHNAWEKYLIRKAKLEESVTDNPRFQALVELGIFLAAAEYAKRFILAERMFRDVQEGKAAVLAVKFKKTIIAVTTILNEKYGVNRNLISLIWGGGQTQLTAKQKLKAQVREKEDLFKQAGISMEDMMLEDVDDRVLEDLPEHLRLGSQTKEERQKEIDRFQSGKSLYAIYTFKAGGVGLSLHHTDEQTSYKVRRQKNGYAVVEDICNVPTRPRKTTVSPTWSPIEMVQGVGRVPRLTSLSDSEQTLLFYKGTVEEEQAFVVTHRLKCLSKVVRQHESWQDLITNHVKAKEIARKLVEDSKLTEDTEEEKSGGFGETEEEE